MKIKVITESGKNNFENNVNLEVLALKGDGKQIKDIKYGYALMNGLEDVHSAMIIYE